jgi:hypothetical protein
MDTPENQNQIRPGGSDVQAQVDALRHVLVSALVLLLIVSGTFNLYLWRQYRTTRGELQAVLPNAPKIAGELTGMQDFVRKLVDFSKTHPDFAPVLSKYGIQPTAASAGPPAASAPQPGAAAPKK